MSPRFPGLATSKVRGRRVVEYWIGHGRASRLKGGERARLRMDVLGVMLGASFAPSCFYVFSPMIIAARDVVNESIHSSHYLLTRLRSLRLSNHMSMLVRSMARYDVRPRECSRVRSSITGRARKRTRQSDESPLEDPANRRLPLSPLSRRSFCACERVWATAGCRSPYTLVSAFRCPLFSIHTDV